MKRKTIKLSTDKTVSTTDKQHLFKKGQSGNPAGRKFGSKSKTTILLGQMLQGQAEQLVQKAIDMALKGDSQMLRALLDKLLPNRKDLAVKIRLPPISTAADLPKITAAVLKAVSTGKLTPTEGTALSQIIDKHRAAVELTEIEARLTELETKINEEGKNYDQKSHR